MGKSETVQFTWEFVQKLFFVMRDAQHRIAFDSEFLERSRTRESRALEEIVEELRKSVRKQTGLLL